MTYNYEDGRLIPKEIFELANTHGTGLVDDFDVTLRITEACDLNCKYCMYWHEGGHYAIADILKSIDVLFEFFVKEKMKAVTFYYHGGEPSRHPKIIELLEYIQECSRSTGVIAYTEFNTNLTMGAKLLDKLLPYIDRLNVSYHYNELSIKPRKYKAFYDNFASIKAQNITIHNFDIMLDTVPLDKLLDFYSHVEDLISYPNAMHTEMIYGFWHYGESNNRKSKDQHLEFHNLHNDPANGDQYFKLDGKQYTTNELFIEGVNCVGWRCSSGSAFIYVNGDGSVFSCGMHMTSYIRPEIREQAFTNLVSDKSAVTKLSILRKTGTVCRWTYCGGDYPRARFKPK